MTKRALVLANIGTPDAPTPEKVRAYLSEFLMDPQVIDLPWPVRAAFVHGFVLGIRNRAATSAAQYKKIWTERGSPLLFHLEDLAARVRLHLGDDWIVIPAMRYGKPSFADAVREIARSGAQDTVFLPLFPQFSLAATESSVAAFNRAIAAPGKVFRFIPAFYDRPEFVSAFASIAKRELAGFAADHVLFSFHGLPERQIRRTDSSGKHCLASPNCCDSRVEANRFCYRSQSYATAHALAHELALDPSRYSVSFQSRMGRTKWIEPYTDHVIPELVKKGVRNLAVVCPSFVADCLETLEEIGIRARTQFEAAGGRELRLVPCLNSEPEWASAVAKLVLN